jgi:uncharacterized protein YcbX
MQISSLHIYPVKSMQGIDVDSALINQHGLRYDRQFMVVDLDGNFVTQRTVPGMATIATALDAKSLLLAHAGHSRCVIPLASDPAAPTIKVHIWKHQNLVAEDCGEEAARWLSRVMQGDYRLVRAGNTLGRKVLKAAATDSDEFAFADGAPVLVCSEASLAELNHRIAGAGGTPVPMNRFRPNIVVRGCGAFEEDGWPALACGAVAFINAGPSERCAMTTTDQKTGIRGKEPLKTLAMFRRLPLNSSAVFFGCNYINTSKQGEIRIGDTLNPAP